MRRDQSICPSCGGSGRGKSFTRPDDPCGACGGTGKVQTPEPQEPKRDAAWLRQCAQRIAEHEQAALEGLA